ncbi:MAG: sigma 54-interacting transcriptional regulator [Bilophila wadsworthia]
MAAVSRHTVRAGLSDAAQKRTRGTGAAVRGGSADRTAPRRHAATGNPLAKRQIQRRDAPKNTGEAPSSAKAETVRLAGAAGGHDGRRRPALWETGAEKTSSRGRSIFSASERGPLWRSIGQHPGTAFESEFFGHEKGSFTGATSQKIGYFEMANGGTLFIDEVGEMPLSMQVKLLRVLQNQRFMRVGGTAEIISRFRLVAATNRDLRDEVAKGRFREDLFYRLSVVPLRVPPLRERREDIIGLAEAFAESYCQRYGRPSLRLTDADRACLLNYSWPGNVRELKNIIERAVILNAPLLELVSPSRATASGSGRGPSSSRIFHDPRTRSAICATSWSARAARSAARTARNPCSASNARPSISS